MEAKTTDPTEGMTPAVLARREPLPGRPGIAFFRIEPAPGTVLPRFLAGQAVPIAFPSGEDVAVRWYSIASSPARAAAWRFLIARVEAPGGASQDLFALPEGGSLHVGQPAGGFTLERAGGRPHLAFLAAGTGLAPFLSMAGGMLDGEEARPASLLLLHGVRCSKDLAAREELESAARRAPFPMHYLPCVSRPGQDPGFDAERMGRGRADAILRALLGLPSGGSPAELPGGVAAGELRALLPPGESAIFLCGHPGMIDGMNEAATGTPWAEALVYEKWW